MNLSRKFVVVCGMVALCLLVATIPVRMSAQEDRRPERGRDFGRLPADVWRVEEGINGQVVWAGTWTRRGRSDVFDAVWRNQQNGAEARDTLRVVEARDRIVIHRDGTNGEYTGRFSRDGAHMEGTASWYTPGGFWRADAASPVR